MRDIDIHVLMRPNRNLTTYVSCGSVLARQSQNLPWPDALAVRRDGDFRGGLRTLWRFNPFGHAFASQPRSRVATEAVTKFGRAVGDGACSNAPNGATFA